MISLIWAMDKNNLIGKDDLIPWHVKEDLLYFKEKTKDKTVLMGDVTYYSLKGYYKNRPLPFKKMFIASIDTNLKIDGCEVINDVKAFLKNYKEDIFVIGGSTIYSLSLEFADRLYVSIISGEYTGNRYFPNIDFSKYKKISENTTQFATYLIYEK